MINFEVFSISKSLKHYRFLEIFMYKQLVYNPRISIQSESIIRSTFHTKFHFFGFLSEYYIFQ
jgi:hypothetical protein